MVAAFGRPETVFTVLAESARRRRTLALAVQLAASAFVAGAIVAAAPRWWSLAFLAGWSAAYSAWGLVVRAERDEAHRRSVRAILTTLTALGTALAIAGIIGVGLLIYSGDAAGAKNGRCVRNATSKRCQLWERPAQNIRLP